MRSTLVLSVLVSVVMAAPVVQVTQLDAVANGATDAGADGSHGYQVSGDSSGYGVTGNAPVSAGASNNQQVVVNPGGSGAKNAVSTYPTDNTYAAGSSNYAYVPAIPVSSASSVSPVVSAAAAGKPVALNQKASDGQQVDPAANAESGKSKTWEKVKQGLKEAIDVGTTILPFII